MILKDRQVIEIKGSHRRSFLQPLISNDINKLDGNNLIYSTLLNPQGRFLYDFFIFEFQDKIFLDCHQVKAEEIVRKLNFYKLKSLVEINIALVFKVASVIEGSFDISSLGSDFLIYSDPRSKEMGYRGYTMNFAKNFNYPNDLEDNYHFKRIKLKIAEGQYDLTYDKSFILEYGFDNLNAIDYKKGCYIGQEVTARTHYLGQIRKKLFHIEIDSLSEIAKNTEIIYHDRSVGIILSSVFIDGKLNALALIRNDDNFDLSELQTMSNKITIIS